MATRISASKFKERCLALLDHLDSDGLVITKHGRAEARVLPARAECKDSIGGLAGKIKIKGDIESTGIEWEAKS